MSEIVRIADADRVAIKWPQRCPRCGSTDFLVSRNIVVRRDHRRRRPTESALHYFQSADRVGEGLRIAVPMCPRHARPNQVGGTLLRDDRLARLFRLAIHVCFAWAVLIAAAAWNTDVDSRAALDALPRITLEFAAFGLVGEAALAWARRVAWVRPIRLDRRFQTAILRFRDDAYAADFRRMNLAATTNAPIAQRPAWMRPSLKGAVLSGLAALFMLPIALVLLAVLFDPAATPSHAKTARRHVAPAEAASAGNG